jgi:hypothetical protein
MRPHSKFLPLNNACGVKQLIHGLKILASNEPATMLKAKDRDCGKPIASLARTV